jgi:putative membrane protein
MAHTFKLRALATTGVALAASVALAACGDNTNQPGQSSPVNAAQDATSAVVGQTSAATLGANTLQGYVTNAAIGDMYEIEAGRMAAERGTSAETRRLGEMLVTDHTASSERMAPLARAAGETPPTEMDERRKGLIDNLRAAQGAEFDRVFASQQVAAHEEALTLHRGYADNGDRAELQAFARDLVPRLESHLEAARQLEAAHSR